jgi:alkylation response protein AidB-like acyl-CoA dehydrogenase
MSTEIDAQGLAAAKPGEVGRRFQEWLDKHALEVERFLEPEPHDVVAADRLHEDFIRLLYRAGWTRLGWPEEFGGLGGNLLLRAEVYDRIGLAGLAMPERLYPLEILAPALIRFAPDLARDLIPAYLSGDEFWCQGFSEPEAGSDLASLRCRAVQADDGFVVNGQKIWTSNAQMSSRCMLLARTGTLESRHRGLSMLLVDMDQPGITVRPIRAATGADHLAEVFFDEVHVPASRLVGEVDRGWAVAMYLLQFERGMYAWMRQAVLHHRVSLLASQLKQDRATAAGRLGGLYVAVAQVRAQTAQTLARFAGGEVLGPEVSVDKLLLSRAEQLVCDVARELLSPALEIGDADAWTTWWRSAWYFSRAATILGGTREVQKGIVAERLLGLPRGGADGR